MNAILSAVRRHNTLLVALLALAMSALMITACDSGNTTDEADEIVGSELTDGDEAVLGKEHLVLLCHVGHELPEYDPECKGRRCGDAGKIDLITVTEKAAEKHFDSDHTYNDVSDYYPADQGATGVGNEDTDGNHVDDGCEPMGTIVVVKETLPDGDPTQFTFSGDVSGTIGDGGQLSAQLAPGNYAVSETVPSGWDLTSAVCSDGSPDDINLDAGETVTCTFTNTKRGGVTIIKETDPGNAPDLFDFTSTLPFLPSVQLRSGDSFTNGDLLPGTYTVTETVPSGWELTAITCNDDNSTGDTGTGQVTINVEPGEVFSCTFTNTEQAASTGTITITKQCDTCNAFVEPEFGFSITPALPGAPFRLSDGDSKTFLNVPAGTYDVTETEPGGFGLIEVDCDDDDSDWSGTTATIILDAGETVECTFVNES